MLFNGREVARGDGAQAWAAKIRPQHLYGIRRGNTARPIGRILHLNEMGGAEIRELIERKYAGAAEAPQPLPQRHLSAAHSEFCHAKTDTGFVYQR